MGIKEKLHIKDGENKSLFQKFIEFFVSRLLGTVVDMAVLWVFSHLVFTGYWGAYWISPTISFEAAVFTNFVCSYYWIWKTRVTNRSRKSFWRHFIGFNLSSVAGFLVKMVFLLLFERIFHWDVVWCNLAALTISGIFNYYLAEAVVFRKKHHKSDSSAADTKKVTEINGSPIVATADDQVVADTTKVTDSVSNSTADSKDADSKSEQ